MKDVTIKTIKAQRGLEKLINQLGGLRPPINYSKEMITYVNS